MWGFVPFNHVVGKPRIKNIVSINPNGDVSGTAYSTTFADNYFLEGSVSSSGQFQATFGTSSVGGEFTGQLNGNSGSGTWVNTGAMMDGSWSGSKD